MTGEGGSLHSQLLVADDLREGVRRQRGPADETAINVRLCHQFFHIADIHRPTVLNDRLSRDLGAIFLRDRGPNEGMYLLRDFFGAYQTRTNRPDRFIYEDKTGSMVKHAVIEQARGGELI